MAVTNYFTADGQIYGEETVGTFRGYIPDALGSVMATTTGGTSAENTYRYKPYGELLIKTGAAADPKFLWIGQWGYRLASDDYRLHYVRFRHFSSDLASWLVADAMWPIERAFTYYGSSPTFRIDPTGFGSCFDPCEDCKKATDLCKWYRDNFDLPAGVLGFVACCQGRGSGEFVICDVVDEKYKDASKVLRDKIRECVRLHETVHRDDERSVCRSVVDGKLDPRCGRMMPPVTGPPPREDDPDPYECTAYKKELGCALKHWKGHTCKDKSIDQILADPLCRFLMNLCCMADRTCGAGNFPKELQELCNGIRTTESCKKWFERDKK